jgi:crotonyl-CoA carboxylase/reductase
VTHVKVGDEVVMHCGTWDRNCAWVKSGGDPMYSPSFRIWGYETNFGSFAQFTKVQAQQCMPKPKHMNWEEAARMSWWRPPPGGCCTAGARMRSKKATWR